MNNNTDIIHILSKVNNELDNIEQGWNNVRRRNDYFCGKVYKSKQVAIVLHKIKS